MNAERKKELQEEYKNRKLEMGVISIRCKATGETFYGISKKFQADFNSSRFKLEMNGHPNKKLQALWNRDGENGFEWTVVKTLNSEESSLEDDRKLEALREECMSADPKAEKIWR